ncbi:MAG: amino acid permease C-terminal domain-containing protein, partial [Pseudomonadota bacterium]|nr:amino acid permease C-terminal domain-containing protein [Pseudomonadota bacterium]
PALFLVGPATILGCVFLFFNLPTAAMLVLPVWGAIGMVIYFGYSRSHSHVGRGIIEVVDDPSMTPGTH